MLTRSLALTSLILASCAPTGGDHDEEIARAAVPQRVDAKGRLRLTPAERAVLGVRVIPVARGTLAATDLRYGVIRPRPGDAVAIAAPLAGRLSATSGLFAGAPVSRGALLLKFSPLLGVAVGADLAARRERVRGQAIASRARLVALAAAVRRQKALAGSGLATAARLAQSKAELLAEKATLKGLKSADRALTHGTSGTIDLRAPISGVLTSIATRVGARFAQGAVMARILRQGPRYVSVARLPSEEPGEGFDVRCGARWLSATLLARGAVVSADGMRRDLLQIDDSRISPATKTSTSRSPQKGVEPKAKATACEFLLGQTVAVRIRHRDEGLVIPETALVPVRGGWEVFVAEDPGRYAPRPVALGARAGGQAIIKTGLRVGLRVVVQGAMELLGEIGHVRGLWTPRKTR